MELQGPPRSNIVASGGLRVQGRNRGQFTLMQEICDQGINRGATVGILQA